MEKLKILIESTPVQAYGIRNEKHRHPRHDDKPYTWKYTEDQDAAMCAVDDGCTVVFVKMYRLAGGELVKEPYIDAVQPYSLQETATEEEILQAHGGCIDSVEVHALLRQVPAPAEGDAPNQGKTWGTVEIETLKKWHAYNRQVCRSVYNREQFAKIVGKRLGRTPVAIAYKLHALGLEPTHDL